MKLVVTTAAARDLAKFSDKGVARDILRRMEAIAADPFAAHPNVQRLKGAGHAWRLRKGDWRALYVVNRRAETVILERVMNRREAYR